MAPGSCACRSLCVNFLTDFTEQDKLAGAQVLVRKFKARSNTAPTTVLTPPESPTPPLIFLPTKDLFTKFMKILIKKMQAQVQALAEIQE